jgi:uncharacterized protein YecT (DUF1311 family)
MWRWLFIVLLWTGMVAGAGAAPEKRVALVIGNARYQHVAPLDNPDNDARMMAVSLRDLGFELVGGQALLDLDKSGLDEAVQRFGSELQGADVGLFYYAGHGVQVRGENYLVPVSANPVREADLDFQMLNTTLVLRQMEAAGTRLNVIILDACRNNPFAGRSLRALNSGLAQMRAPEGTLISFATQPGSVALDGASGNSPYTAALVKTIRRPGLDLFQTFNEVGLAVKRLTAGAQQPWVSSSPISGRFYFAGASTPPPAGLSPPTGEPAYPDREAERAWGVTKDTTSIAVLQDFIRQFGDTPYGSMARARLGELQRSQQGAVAPRPGLPRYGALPTSLSPSFDCATNRSVVEVTICGSGRLSYLDRQMDGLYGNIRRRLNRTSQRVLRDEQRAWLQQRDGCGSNETCLVEAYETRIAELHSRW